MRGAARLLTLSSLLVVAPAQADDLTIVSKVTGEGAQDTNRTWYLTPTKLRMSTTMGDVIMDVAAGKITVLDHAKKQYWETTQEEVNKSTSEAASRMTEQTKQNPQAAKLMEQLMGNLAGSVSVQHGPGSKKIVGYTCEQYIVSMGPIKEDVWVTTEITPPLTLSQIMAAQKAFFAGNPMAGSMKGLADEMAKIKGFPLGQSVTITMLGRTNQTNSEAIEVKKDPVPASVFAIPAGYTKTQPPMSALPAKRP
jgi:hypothetical protein